MNSFYVVSNLLRLDHYYFLNYSALFVLIDF